MKLRAPEADDKSEMAGRIYEACDLKIAIEEGHLKTIEDVLAWAKESVAGMQKLMELPVWVISENACVDIRASVEHNQATPKDILAEAASMVLEKFPPRFVTITQDISQLERLYPKGGAVKSSVDLKGRMPE